MASEVMLVENMPNTTMPLLAQLVYGTYSELKTKKCLTHDQGNGSPCLKCQEMCIGLELHFWRKVCKNCGCKLEDHKVEVDQSIHEAIVHNLLNDDYDNTSPWECSTDDDVLEGHPLLEHLSRKKRIKSSSKFDKEQNESKKEEIDSYDQLLKLGAENNGINNDSSTNSEKKKRASKSKEKERQRQRLLVRQIPPQDFEVGYCHELNDYEKEELGYFTLLVQMHTIGKAILKEKNEESEMNCAYCSNSIDFKSNYLVVERLQGKVWHDCCLRCKICDESLVDGIYFLEGGDLYCGRHFAETYKPRCHACDELIFSKEYTQAEQKNWHTKHFCCYKCETYLGGMSYVTVGPNPYCIPCYNDKIAYRCSACSRAIEVESDLINSDDKNWHTDCFSKLSNGLRQMCLT